MTLQGMADHRTYEEEIKIKMENWHIYGQAYHSYLRPSLPFSAMVFLNTYAKERQCCHSKNKNFKFLWIDLFCAFVVRQKNIIIFKNFYRKRYTEKYKLAF